MPKNSLNGTIAYFNGDKERLYEYVNAAYQSAPNMNIVAETYSGLRADNHKATVTVDSAGTLSGPSTDGCTFVGTLSPRTKGNVFHTSLTFGGGACRHGAETVTGVAFYDASAHRLYSPALNSARTSSFVFIGTKQ